MLAEEINNWLANDYFERGSFNDLLDLEEHLADFSDLVIIFVESPGSIAELGAFAALDLLRSKTLAVLNSSHAGTGNFIADGPVQRLRATGLDLVQYFPWRVNKKCRPTTREKLTELSAELSMILVKREKMATKERQLADTHGHKMLLAADLINIMAIATSDDISQCLRHWGYSMRRESLKKYLSLLLHFKIIDMELYGSQRFYVSRATDPFVLYDFVAGTRIRDRLRVKDAIRVELNEINDHRTRALRAYIERSSKGARYV